MKDFNPPHDATMMDTRMLWRHSLRNARRLALAQMLAALLAVLTLTLAVHQSGLRQHTATAPTPVPATIPMPTLAGVAVQKCAPQTVSKNWQRICKPDTIGAFDGL